MTTHYLIRKAERLLAKGQPLPVDLTLDLLNAGFDAQAIEDNFDANAYQTKEDTE